MSPVTATDGEATSKRKRSVSVRPSKSTSVTVLGNTSGGVWPRDPPGQLRTSWAVHPTSPCGPYAQRRSPEWPPGIRASYSQRSLRSSWLGLATSPGILICRAPGAVPHLRKSSRRRRASRVVSVDGICPWTSARHKAPPRRCPWRGAVRDEQGPSLGTADGSGVCTAGLTWPCRRLGQA